MTRVTSAQGHKSRDAQRRAALSRMLRNTLQNYPTAKLLHSAGGFGVLLGQQRSLFIRCSGNLSAADIRDLLALFVTWLAVDPDRLFDVGLDGQGGASYVATEERYLSHGRLA